MTPDMSSPLVTVSQRYQREAHQSLLMQHLREAKGLSRAELARRTGLKRATVTTIMQPFILSGIVYEGAHGFSAPTGGRRPVALHINTRAACIAGIDIDPTEVHAVLTGIDGTVFERITFGTPEKISLGFQIAGAVETCRNLFSSYPVIAFGVSISGTVNPLTGTIIESHIHGVRDYELSEFLLPIREPVLLENDANCGAWAQILHSGGAWGNGLFIFPRLTFDATGKLSGVELGGSVIVDGRVWRGSRFVTGEFSLNSWFSDAHNQVPFPRSRLLEINTDRAVRKRFVSEILKRLLTTVRLLDVDRIMCAGIEHELLEQLLHSELQDTWYTQKDHRTRLVCSEMNRYTAAVGAASYVLARLYQIDHIGCAQSQFDIDWDYVLSSVRRS
jgi:hypothetical protein